MGLRDRFRSRQPASDEDEPTGASTGDAPPEPIVFRPRFDGSYIAETGVTLRFSPSSVQETGGHPLADEPATSPRAADEPAVGEYTSSGRFAVQRQFSRPIVYTVLSSDDDGFTARRTDTNQGGGSAPAAFRFRPAAPA